MSPERTPALAPGKDASQQSWLREAQRALEARDYRRAHGCCIRALTGDPTCADALFLLGVIAAEHENFGKAAQLMERAIRLDPQRAEYHAHLGRCLIALSEPRAAMEAAAHALSLEPSDAPTLDTIGVVLTRAGAHEEALQPFKLATERNSGNAAYQYNYAASLQFSGRFEHAAQAYRRALELDPRCHRAWSSLAQVTRGPLPSGDLERINEALERETDVDAELHLRHALARHYEELHQYGAAFAQLERGKRCKRLLLEYSADAEAGLFDAARGTTPAADDLARGGAASAEPIFIIGMPRTGTTLVERILSSHPDVFAAGELTQFALVTKRAARTPGALVLDAPTLAAAAKLDPTSLGDAYIQSTRPRTGRTPRFIDKMPLNFFYAGLIRRALPQAKIICLRRNPLDTCLSNYRQLFATSFSYYNYAYDLLETGRYFLMFDALAKHWCAHLGDNYCEVHYESLVTDTESEARRLLAFCGLDWREECLRFHENAAPVATASSVQVRQPIYRTSVERWRKYEPHLAALRALLAQHGVRA